jgi:hypothetical protein
MTASVVHQDPAHRTSSNREELRSLRPLSAPLVHELQVRFVNEIGGREGVIRALSRKLSVSDFPELRVDAGQKAVGGIRCTSLQRKEILGDLLSICAILSRPISRSHTDRGLPVPVQAPPPDVPIIGSPIAATQEHVARHRVLLRMARPSR